DEKAAGDKLEVAPETLWEGIKRRMFSPGMGTFEDPFPSPKSFEEYTIPNRRDTKQRDVDLRPETINALPETYGQGYIRSLGVGEKREKQEDIEDMSLVSSRDYRSDRAAIGSFQPDPTYVSPETRQKNLEQKVTVPSVPDKPTEPFYSKPFYGLFDMFSTPDKKHELDPDWYEKTFGPKLFPPRKSNGGSVFGAGGPTSDSINAYLSDGEFVVKTASAKKLGYGALEHINKHGELPGYNEGGLRGPE
ncbi:unnamed protein product, partial [marine sediment metagenome]